MSILQHSKVLPTPIRRTSSRLATRALLAIYPKSKLLSSRPRQSLPQRQHHNNCTPIYSVLFCYFFQQYLSVYFLCILDCHLFPFTLIFFFLLKRMDGVLGLCCLSYLLWPVLLLLRIRFPCNRHIHYISETFAFNRIKIY